MVDLGEHRDGPALLDAFQRVLREAGVAQAWINAATIGCTFDGAKVLLSTLASLLRELRDSAGKAVMAHLYVLYCCSHRVQLVDKACTSSSRCKQIHSILNRVAKFFGKSTKRWHGLQRIALSKGYDQGIIYGVLILPIIQRK